MPVPETPLLAADIIIRLENEVSDALHLQVDLVEKRALKPHIGRYILREVVAV